MCFRPGLKCSESGLQLAESFQKVCGLNPAFTANFGEEVVRGQPLFVLSWLLQSLGPMLRSTAGVGNWLVSPSDPQQDHSPSI